MATIAELGFALAHPTRARALETLLSGRYCTMSDLARLCRAPNSSMSEHLSVLERTGLVRATRIGRHRYFTLASHEVANWLEAAGLLSAPFSPRSLGESERMRLERAGRFCWRHLAGNLGVQLRDLLVRAGALKEIGDDALVTSYGSALIAAEFGIHAARDTIVRSCVDGTERLLHIRGPLGVEFARAFIARRFVRHGPGRAAILTAEGKNVLDRIADALGEAAS